jgi:hypothetical protein
MNNFITEKNAERPASKKQLWALYCLTKKDYRGQDLTMFDASKLIERFNASKVVSKIGVNDTNQVRKISVKAKKPTLEQEFISYMAEQIQEIIATCKQAIKIKSVVEDDPTFCPNKKDKKQFVFFGFGCGITIIDFDKRSKKGKVIKELSNKHRMTTFLKMFLKGFTTKEIKYFENVGFPLQAMYYQDIKISAAYEHAVASFMTKQGVKNVRCRTFDD